MKTEKEMNDLAEKLKSGIMLTAHKKDKDVDCTHRVWFNKSDETIIHEVFGKGRAGAFGGVGTIDLSTFKENYRDLNW